MDTLLPCETQMKEREKYEKHMLRRVGKAGRGRREDGVERGRDTANIFKASPQCIPGKLVNIDGTTELHGYQRVNVSVKRRHGCLTLCCAIGAAANGKPA